MHTPEDVEESKAQDEDKRVKQNLADDIYRHSES